MMRSRLRQHTGISAGLLDDEHLTNILLVSLMTMFGAGCVLWVGAAAGALVTGHGIPDGGPLTALLALRHLGRPSAAWSDPAQLPGPVMYWTSTTLVLVVALSAVGWLIRRILGRADPDGVAGFRSLPGLASARDVGRAAGQRSVLSRASIVRPSLVNPKAHDVGYHLGTIKGRELWCSVEDSALLIGPPRMGKSLHMVNPWIVRAPGAVMATSTRPDTLSATRDQRRKVGPVAFFDPQMLSDLPRGLRWSPVRGCKQPRTALVRARGLAAGVGWGKGVSDGEFWAGQTETALRCLLHAAALDGRRAGDLYRWSLDPALTADAVGVLMRHPDAAPGWGDALDAATHADPRTRDSVWLGVRQALAALADPVVLDAVDPGPGESFDPESFLTTQGTLYLLAPATTSASSAPLVASFIEDVTETARRLAARSPGARLDAPLLLALDEIANLTPLPSLPALMAEGGGTGITTLAVLQSPAQARHRWGEHAADAIWDAATVKLILGGLARKRDLEDIAALLGEIDETTHSVSRGRSGERTTSTAVRRVPVMPPDALRMLPFGTAVLLLRQGRPAVIDLPANDGQKMGPCRRRGLTASGS